MPNLRIASVHDSRPLAELAETTFRETFADANTAEDMRLHCTSSYGEAIQLGEITNPAMLTLLAEEDGRLIGFAQMRWGDAPSCVAGKAPGEIQRLYVERSWHGKGAAQELMATCIAAMEQRNTDTIWLGVWERNPRAMTFYRKFGFIEAGDHVFPLGKDPQRDIIMARAVRPQDQAPALRD